MRFPKAACWLLLVFACACDRVSLFSDVKPQDLPRGVEESIHQHWPGVRVHSVQRVYNGDSWGDYQLIFELPGGATETATLSETGVVKWRSHPIPSNRARGSHVQKSGAASKRVQGVQ